MSLTEIFVIGIGLAMDIKAFEFDKKREINYSIKYKCKVKNFNKYS